jgi:hypothetical protein
MNRVPSNSPKRGLSDQISAMGAKLGRVLSDSGSSFTKKSDSGSVSTGKSLSQLSYGVLAFSDARRMD